MTSEPLAGLNRAEFLKRAAAAGGTLVAGRQLAAGPASAAGTSLAGKNILVFMTDQDRALQHFPKGWAKQHLPGLTRLKRNGLTFNRAFTNACMCSPARSTWMTGYFPAQHGVKYTLESDMPADQYPQVELPTDLPNLATVAKAAGYTPVYKGKWHLNKPAGEAFVPDDVGKYGWTGWNPPDGGANQDISEGGGGVTDHDGRYMHDAGAGAISYLTSQAAQDAPFFLVVSLVNPHDVLFYPKNYVAAGYDDTWLQGDIELPETVDEDLSTKPKAQARFKRLFDFTGKLTDATMQRNYLNFYGNLMKASDAYLVEILDTLQSTGLLDDTIVIRTADHGEMGLAHGGLRQKNFNFYEESLRVPLVYSNPKLWPKSRKTDALVSHVDFLPTVASLLKAPKAARAKWKGVDYSKLVTGASTEPPQDSIVFTYDDFQGGQSSGPYIPAPNRIVSIRERRWKLAKYYDAAGEKASVFEMYDLRNDPLEKRNLCARGFKRSDAQQKAFRRLRVELAELPDTRLAPLA